MKSPPIRPHEVPEQVLAAEQVEGAVVEGEEEVQFERVEDQDAEEGREVIDVDDDELDGREQDPDREGADARVLPDPGEPTDAQREEHRAKGHIPYRSWCRECVEGRSTGEAHRRRTGDRSISVFSFDYLFLDKAGRAVKKDNLGNREDVDVTILVAKESTGKSIFAHVVPQKGIDMDHYAVDLLLKDLQWTGYQRISLRSDNEPAILKLLQHAVTEARLTVTDLQQVIDEHPNAYDSAGNGEIEVAVKSVSGILRTNKLDFEKRLGKSIPQEHPVFSWLVEYCAWMLNVRNRGEDGQTAYKRVRGREYTKRLLPFGELVLAHLPIKGPDRLEGGALEARTKEGIFLGYGTKAHSYMVYVDGIVKPFRSVYRVPLSKRWSSDKVEQVDISVQSMHTGRGG